MTEPQILCDNTDLETQNFSYDNSFRILYFNITNIQNIHVAV
jgi:hypothetical protein